MKIDLKISNNAIKYIAIIIAVLDMGSAYFQVMHMPLMAVMMILAGGVLLLMNPAISRTNFIFYFITTIAFFTTSLINYKNGIRINDVIIWLINISYLTILSSNFSFEEFKKKYSIVMAFEAILSILCFIWGDVLGNTLPFMSWNWNNGYGYYCSPYFTLGWAGSVGIFGRNAGIFHEPGMHQIFLNFALLFFLHSENRFGLSKRQYFVAVIALIAGVLTTMSTTGYMCLGLVLLSVTLSKNRDTLERTSQRIKLLAILAFIILCIVELNTGVVETKILGRNSGGSFNTRYNDTMSGYSIAIDNSLFGVGYFAANTAELLSSYGVSSISNGMASFAMRAGIILLICMLIMVFLGIKRSFPHGILSIVTIFIFYLFCVNSEGSFMNLLYMSFMIRWEPLLEESIIAETSDGGPRQNIYRNNWTKIDIWNRWWLVLPYSLKRRGMLICKF